jgi:hypothetical protein
MRDTNNDARLHELSEKNRLLKDQVSGLKGRVTTLEKQLYEIEGRLELLLWKSNSGGKVL